MTLTYNREGSGDRTVLCITGLNGHAGFWTKCRKALSDTCTVISFDQRGCGDNSNVAGKHTLAEIVSDTIDILDDAGVHSAIVVGHSMGGVITQCLALDHPERVRAAVFSGTFCVFDWYMQNTNNLRQELLDKVGTEACARFSAMLAMPSGNVMDERYDLHSRITNVSSKAQDDVIMERMRAPYGFDRRAELPRIAMPALVIGAADDLLAPLYQSRMIADLIPDARLEVIDGGHFFPNTRPEIFWDIVGAFIMSQPAD